MSCDKKKCATCAHFFETSFCMRASTFIHFGSSIFELNALGENCQR